MNSAEEIASIASLEAHPHAAAVLGAALNGKTNLSHAYLFHGPAGSGKRSAALAFSAELVTRGASDSARTRRRALALNHPDVTYVSPSGAHEMLRSDIDSAVITACSLTPFEAQYRCFILDGVEKLNDEAANSLLKSLEEPSSFVVLLLLTDRLHDVLPTIVSRCQTVRFEGPSIPALVEGLRIEGIDEHEALACARLSLGDADGAKLLADRSYGLRRHATEYARSVLDGTAATRRPWQDLLRVAAEIADGQLEELDSRLDQELDVLPKKEHKRRKTEHSDQRRRSMRRIQTTILDHALRLIGLYYRDLICMRFDAADFTHNSDQLSELREKARDLSETDLSNAIEVIDKARASLRLNVTYELMLEALAYRLQSLLRADGLA